MTTATSTTSTKALKITTPLSISASSWPITRRKNNTKPEKQKDDAYNRRPNDADWKRSARHKSKNGCSVNNKNQDVEGTAVFHTPQQNAIAAITLLDTLLKEDALNQADHVVNILNQTKTMITASVPPLPELPRGRITSPRRPPLSPVPPAASSRLSLLVRAPPGRAVAFPGVAAASSSPALPPIRGEITGDVSSPAKQWRCRHCTASSRPCRAAQVRAGCAISSLSVAASPSTPACPRFRRNAVARAASPSVSSAPTPAAPSAVPVRRPTSPSPPLASQRQGRPRHRFPSIQTPPRSIVVASVRSRRRRPVGRPVRRLAAPPPSWASLRRVPRRPRIRAAAAGCPSSPPRRPRSSSSSSSRRSQSSWRSSLRRAVLVRPRCFVKVAVAVVVFVLGSASSSLVPAASRLRPRIAAEAVPSSFVSVVPVCLRRARSSLSFPRLVAWWLVALLVCFA
ncbi:uncharacterized protein [Oryza sativa Japonica Group]|uniref:uncharacterized protein n=1 Tax=Oryza sativa subsp. japonica TaxID=39947 RepID=UPI00339CD1FD